MSSIPTSTDLDHVMVDELYVEHLLTEGLSPDTSFASDATSTDPHDDQEVESMLKPPNTSDKFDLAHTIFDCEDPEFDQLDIERHAWQCDPLAKADDDFGFAASGAQVLPFPIIAPHADTKEIVVRHPLDFCAMFLPYLSNASFTLLADEPHNAVPPCPVDETTQNPKLPRPRRHLQLVAKIRAGLKHTASVAYSPVVFQDLPTTRGDWKGQDFRHRLDSKGLRQAWLNGTVCDRLRNDDFRKISYEGQPTCFVDKNLVMYAFRTERIGWLLQLMPAGSPHRTHQDRLNWECEQYRTLCGDNSPAAIRLNHRGDHFASTPGVDRQSKKEPTWTKFYTDHKQATDWLLQPDNVTVRLIKMAASILRIRFPIIAQRVDRCTATLIDMGVDRAVATPLFGLWYNYCINAARPHAGIEGVSCQPHTDAQNLAIMMCALFVYGKFSFCDFDWNEMAWLVLWEARLIIQLPIGVLFFYPSALFIHFNINICDLHDHIYTTDNRQRPTRDNCKPINGVKGRGSIVFFNQASVFQYAELGSTVRDAKQQGRPTAAQNESYIASLPRLQ
ncbi:hypothetical protein GSI_10943 [Ganoderma sinense ZZ0214-1]|uniref:Uncharacterized protein n=1 Tax=Ganoderma sinense ZZ0214-1 TaxID=1077348 RepID=A0A2G8S1Z0_9APHY|nr:hypothetical protein GSI_10943 [Ganoderma sinense ZZ0214-1]